MPRPQGSGTVVLNGLNDVMSSLLDLGLIDESQMFMARMMVGGFMMPTGDDELTSEFKITPDGEFLQTVSACADQVRRAGSPTPVASKPPSTATT